MEKLGYPPKSKEYKIILQEIRAHDIDGDKDNINYKEFTNSLERSFDISCDNRTKGRVYGQAFRDSIGMSMQVKESAFALSLGQVINRGDDAKYQRDYGKTSQPGDRPDKEKAMFKSHSGILGQSADPKYFSIMRASSTGVTGALEGLQSLSPPQPTITTPPSILSPQPPPQLIPSPPASSKLSPTIIAAATGTTITLSAIRITITLHSSSTIPHHHAVVMNNDKYIDVRVFATTVTVVMNVFLLY
jgi:hypothetical protein